MSKLCTKYLYITPLFLNTKCILYLGTIFEAKAKALQKVVVDLQN